MNLAQRKLTKAEWEGIEIPVSLDEKKILNMIKNGFENISTRYNDTKSLQSYIKTENAEELQSYMFEKYFLETIKKLNKKYDLGFDITKSKKIKLKKKDIIRIENFDKFVETEKENIFEFIVIKLIESMLKNLSKKQDKTVFYYYTIYNLNKFDIENVNKVFKTFIDFIISKYKDCVSIKFLLENSKQVIENNSFLWKYCNISLYKHQKQIFTLFKSNSTPKLVLYTAPTATGKTLTPVGLAEKYKIIFVCAARHVGLALAKSAISSGRKIALAFNCGDAEDIRLHYAAAKDFSRNKKTGNIRKVDNTNGVNVEIIISDIKSYLPAMYYMLAFNRKENIITYWDEPTITMDYNSHSFHEIIKKNWSENIVPNIVLSSATLPREDEIYETISDYKVRFSGEIHSILSDDCKKTIPLLKNDCSVYLPHLSFENYKDMLSCVKYIQSNKTLLRYFDLSEIIRFITYVSDKKYIKRNTLYVENYFTNIDTVNMYEIKLYYLLVLQNIIPEHWPDVYNYFKTNVNKIYDSNINIVSSDSYTLTDGPTIFMAKDIEKIALFYLKSAKIPENIMQGLIKEIEMNTYLTIEINKLEKDYDDLDMKENEKDKDRENVRNKKTSNTGKKISPEMRVIKERITSLVSQIKAIMLDHVYVPNKETHLEKWAKGKDTKNVFSSNISEDTIIRIAKLTDISTSWKILLIMGIGVFTDHPSIPYTEIMKELADAQQLFMILASSDYIYGTNYQFCHGYVSKDLSDITQEKTIQAMGRIGRNKMQQQYSVRFRNDDVIKQLFVYQKDRPEVKNMNILFNS
tara:strand:- start:3295 stop:5706 length:2412 start_codon:yes stop_codon:yes gene_type:complete